MACDIRTSKSMFTLQMFLSFSWRQKHPITTITSPKQVRIYRARLLMLASTIDQSVRLAGSYRCWFVKKYCWLVCVREKYCSSWKFTIVYDEPQPNEQAKIIGDLKYKTGIRTNKTLVRDTKERDTSPGV